MISYGREGIAADFLAIGQARGYRSGTVLELTRRLPLLWRFIADVEASTAQSVSHLPQLPPDVAHRLAGWLGFRAGISRGAAYWAYRYLAWILRRAGFAIPENPFPRPERRRAGQLSDEAEEVLRRIAWDRIEACRARIRDGRAVAATADPGAAFSGDPEEARRGLLAALHSQVREPTTSPVMRGAGHGLLVAATRRHGISLDELWLSLWPGRADVSAHALAVMLLVPINLQPLLELAVDCLPAGAVELKAVKHRGVAGGKMIPVLEGDLGALRDVVDGYLELSGGKARGPASRLWRYLRTGNPRGVVDLQAPALKTSVKHALIEAGQSPGLAGSLSRRARARHAALDYARTGSVEAVSARLVHRGLTAAGAYLSVTLEEQAAAALEISRVLAEKYEARRRA